MAGVSAALCRFRAFGAGSLGPVVNRWVSIF